MEQNDTTMKQPRTGLSIQRQTYLAIGSLSFLGIILGVLASGWYLIIPALLSIGMITAGIIGTCTMTKFLAMLPWNEYHSGDIT